jgi:hypothetical protein
MRAWLCGRRRHTPQQLTWHRWGRQWTSREISTPSSPPTRRIWRGRWRPTTTSCRNHNGSRRKPPWRRNSVTCPLPWTSRATRRGCQWRAWRTRPRCVPNASLERGRCGKQCQTGPSASPWNRRSLSPRSGSGCVCRSARTTVGARSAALRCRHGPKSTTPEDVRSRGRQNAASSQCAELRLPPRRGCGASPRIGEAGIAHPARPRREYASTE